MRTTIAAALLIMACDPTEPPPDDEQPTAARTIGTYELEGSQCRVIEVTGRRKRCEICIWDVLQRFSLCDPPLLGMVPGSKPGAVKTLDIP